MKRPALRLESAPTAARRIMDCGGERSAPPLSLATPLEPKRRRRCALPAHSKTRRTFVALWALVCSAITASAQSYSIEWFTIDGGGGTSGGGGYSLSGTIGQPDANAQALTGGNFSLAGGFWALLVVQTPGAPLLTVRLTSTNMAVVLWPSSSAGFTLQEKNNVDTSNWTAASGTVFDNGTNKFIIVNPPAGHRFYRLIGP